LKSTDDFSPIAEQGELELDAGFFSRLKRRREMAPLSAGFTRVILDAQGSPIDELTAGQKYWSRARGWVKVDVRSHPLEYKIPFADPSGMAGFVAVVDVTVSVTDPHAAVSAGAESVEEILRPALQNTVRKAHGKSPVNTSENPVAVLNNLRLAADENLEAIVGRVNGLPDWLEARVTSVHVELDEATAKHREELVEKMRAVAVADADSESEAAKARGQLKVHKIWEDGFANRLADPERRALARIAADPSRENIDRVAAQFDEIEAEGRSAMVAFFRVALEEEYFPEEKAILKALQSMEARLGGPPALKQGEEANNVESASGGDGEDEHIVEAETVETDTHEVERDTPADNGGETGENSDKNWGG
jgi:hypothetical protein